jgi:hypothetical protein
MASIDWKQELGLNNQKTGQVEDVKANQTNLVAIDDASKSLKEAKPEIAGHTDIVTHSTQQPDKGLIEVINKINELDDAITNLQIGTDSDVVCDKCGITFDYTKCLNRKIDIISQFLSVPACFTCPCCHTESSMVTLKNTGQTVDAHEYAAYIDQHETDSD